MSRTTLATINCTLNLPPEPASPSSTHEPPRARANQQTCLQEKEDGEDIIMITHTHKSTHAVISVRPLTVDSLEIGRAHDEGAENTKKIESILSFSPRSDIDPSHFPTPS